MAFKDLHEGVLELFAEYAEWSQLDMDVALLTRHARRIQAQREWRRERANDPQWRAAEAKRARQARKPRTPEQLAACRERERRKRREAGIPARAPANPDRRRELSRERTRRFAKGNGGRPQ